jgi:hypothetical protein
MNILDNNFKNKKKEREENKEKLKNKIENLINIMTASTDRGIKGIKGNGRTKTEKKYLAMIGRGQVSEDLKRSAGDNAINLMTASTDRGIKGIKGNGMTKKDLTKLIIMNSVISELKIFNKKLKPNMQKISNIVATKEMNIYYFKACPFNIFLDLSLSSLIQHLILSLDS